MKNIVKIAFVAAFSAIAGYGVYTSQKTEVMSDLALANVEALASGESSKDCYATICNKDCVVGNTTYTYQSKSKCTCDLCN